MANHNEQSISTPDKTQTAEDVAAEMATAEAAAAAPVVEPSDRPTWLPEKFESAEAMAEAYSNLEKKMSSGKPEATADPEAGLGISKEVAEEAVESAGMDFDALAAKYAEQGSLEDSDYEALEKSGLKRDTVDNYIRGQEAIAQQYQDKIFQEVGDKSAYTEMVTWASQNLPEAQIDMFNEAVESGNHDKALFAINGLKAQYVAQRGSEPGRTIDGRPSTTGPRYDGEAEWIKDCENPKYWTDQAYREKVERKFAATWGG